jgi:pimeloyl-ACP methyl ester carboxylesterase
MLLLIPGLLCDRAIWAKQIDALASSLQISVPDLRGIDRIPIMAQRVLERAPERFSLAGHSLGGRIAFEMMRQAPERIERLALLDTAVIGVQPGERERRMALVEIADRAGMRAVADEWLPPWSPRAIASGADGRPHRHGQTQCARASALVRRCSIGPTPVGAE